MPYPGQLRAAFLLPLVLGAAASACSDAFVAANDPDSGLQRADSSDRTTGGRAGNAAGGGGGLSGSGGARSGSGGAASGSGGTQAGSGGARAGSGGTRPGSGGAAPGDAAVSDSSVPESGMEGSVAQTYEAVILGDAPFVYWRMGIKSGLSVPDETGGGNDLVLQGTGHTLGAPGALAHGDDGAMGFDGTSSFAMASDPRALDFTGGAAFSLECWVRRASSGGDYFQHILGNLQGSVPQRNGYILYMVPNPGTGEIATTAFEYDQPGDDKGIFGPLIAASTWTHLAATFDGKTTALYVDGTLAGTKDITGSISDRTSLFAVARASGETQRFFAGEVDEIAIYERALTITEILRHITVARSP